MKKSPRIWSVVALLLMLNFYHEAGVAAGGYYCSTYKMFTSCATGYYMTQTVDDVACYPTPAPGNACRPCSVMGADYVCDGGMACPVPND